MPLQVAMLKAPAALHAGLLAASQSESWTAITKPLELQDTWTSTICGASAWLLEMHEAGSALLALMLLAKKQVCYALHQA